MLNILGMIILIIILLIIILLLVGIKISLSYEKKGSELKGCFKILIFKKIKVFSRQYPPEDKDSDEEEETEEEDGKERDLKKLYDLAKPCFEDLKIFAKSALNIVKIKRFENHLIFGMDDYADTGKYIGIIWAILASINPMHEKFQLSAEPSFNGSVFDGYGANEIDIYILKLIVPTLRLLSKKHIRELIRGVLDER
jgi:hypothetical protein